MNPVLFCSLNLLFSDVSVVVAVVVILNSPMAGHFPELPWAAMKWLKYENKLGDRMIKQLLNLIIAKYRDLSVSCRSICLSLRLWQIIDLLATDKSRCFAQPRPIIVNCLHLGRKYARILIFCSWTLSVPRSSQYSFPWAMLLKKCLLLGTDNVCGQISLHILVPNDGYCLFSIHLL